MDCAETKSRNKTISLVGGGISRVACCLCGRLFVKATGTDSSADLGSSRNTFLKSKRTEGEKGFL